MSDHDFPNDKEVKRHWNAQDVSVFRAPNSRDPGVSIVNDPRETQSVLEAELESREVALCRARNPATTHDDPMARAQLLIREHHNKGLTAEEFAEKVNTPAEHLLYLILHGKMSDHQRAGHTAKLARMLFEDQKRQLDQLHRERQIEAKQTDLLLKAKRLQQEMIERQQREAKSAKVVDEE